MSLQNDSEESLISQFETTLTIRSTANDEDISMAHSTYFDQTGRGEDEDDDEMFNFTTNQLRTGGAVKVARSAREARERLSDRVHERDRDAKNPVTQRDVRITPKLEPRSRSNSAISNLKHETRSRSNSGRSSSSSKSTSPPINDIISEEMKRYEKILKPSSLVDLSLSKYTKAFSDFLNSNPQIERESPKFRKENDKTLIVLSPYSAEHSFGRKWVTKSYLSTIFERPQRLLAVCIGIAAAVTMYPFFYKIVNSTKKGSIFSPHVLKIHGKSWPKKLYNLCLESHEKLINNELEVPEDWNTGDIYLIPKTINAIEGVIGTIETGIDSLYQQNYNVSFVVIRPPGHHSHASLPSGFCLLNNVQIGIEYAFDKYDVSHVAILDIDLHHGDGSQDICWERAGFVGDFGKDEQEDLEMGFEARDDYGKRFAKYPKVGYFSLHDIKSYPTELGFATKENIKNASTCIMDHDLNIWNVHLQEWEDEDEFYKHYKTKYVSILNRVNQFMNQAKIQMEVEGKQFKPMIIISAGFDALEYENPQMQRHGINVPTSFYSNFTNDVVKLCKIHDSKLLSFLEGGYSDGALTTGVFSHLIGLTNSLNPADKDSNLWNSTWGSSVVMKELVKGCKKNWAPYKQPKSDITIWANEAIKLGRSMMPNAILPNNYIYQYKEENELHRMVKELNVEVPTTPTRHTRSYYKKLGLDG